MERKDWWSVGGTAKHDAVRMAAGTINVGPHPILQCDDPRTTRLAVALRGGRRLRRWHCSMTLVYDIVTVYSYLVFAAVPPGSRAGAMFARRRNRDDWWVGWQTRSPRAPMKPPICGRYYRNSYCTGRAAQESPPSSSTSRA